MSTRSVWACALAAMAGCATVPEPPEKSDFRDVNKSFNAFVACLRAGQYDWAHQALSTESKKNLPLEGIVLAMDSYPSLRRFVGATEARRVEVQGDRARVEAFNPLMGIGYTVTLKKEFGKLWTLDLGPKDLEELTRLGKQWLASQWEDSLGRTLFPPDARPLPSSLRGDAER